MHWLVAVLNICDYSRFVTDMTGTTFGLCESLAPAPPVLVPMTPPKLAFAPPASELIPST